MFCPDSSEIYVDLFAWLFSSDEPKRVYGDITKTKTKKDKNIDSSQSATVSLVGRSYRLQAMAKN